MSQRPIMLLAVPDWAAFDTVARRLDPPVLWPIGPQCLLGHWMDEARRRQAARVVVHCADRPVAVRAWLEGGAYWSCPVEVVPAAGDRWPDGVEWLDALPGEARPTAPRDGAELVRWWLDRQLAWLAQRERHATLLDRPHPAGGWLGPRVRLDPSARLIGPFWIGAQAQVGPGCEIGPGALIGAGVTLDAGVRVLEAAVLADTYVGRNLELRRVLADGGVLIDVGRGCRVEIAEEFILSALARRQAGVPWRERVLAAGLWPVALLAAGLSQAGIGARRWVAAGPSGPIELSEGGRGSLLARRADWLGAVVAGRLRLAGPLPRTEADLAALPTDVANLLRATLPGVFSVADLHGCHRAGEGDENVHALFEATQPGSDRLVWNALPRLLRRHPDTGGT